MCRTTNNQHTPTNRLTDTGGIQRTPRGSPSMQRLRLASASIMQDRDGDNRVVAASLLGRSPQPLGEFSDTFSRLVSLYEEREGPTPRSMGGQAVANFGAKAYFKLCRSRGTSIRRSFPTHQRAESVYGSPASSFDRRTVSQCRRQARWAYNRAVFGSEKVKG